MYNPDNIFAKILTGTLPSKKIYEDEEMLAFYDAYPVAPIHAIVIPKGEYIDYDHFVSTAAPIRVGNFFVKVADVAKLIDAKSYRLVTNKGDASGQSVFHFHVHIIGGTKLDTLI
jgi:histidine triad (HIT) family protein